MQFCSFECFAIARLLPYRLRKLRTRSAPLTLHRPCIARLPITNRLSTLFLARSLKSLVLTMGDRVSGHIERCIDHRATARGAVERVDAYELVDVCV